MQVIAEILAKLSEYIAEAIHQEGDEYFSDMSLKELATDFALYIQNSD